MFSVNLIISDLTKNLNGCAMALIHLSCLRSRRDSHRQLIIIFTICVIRVPQTPLQCVCPTDREGRKESDSFTRSGNSLWSKNNIELVSQGQQMISP